MATELKHLIKCEPRQAGIEQFCQTGCGEATKTFMQITVKAPHITPQDVDASQGGAAPALDMRVCFGCFQKWFHAVAQSGAELSGLVQR